MRIIRVFIVIAGSKAMRHKKRAPKVEKEKTKEKIPTVFLRAAQISSLREKLTTFQIIIRN